MIFLCNEHNGTLFMIYRHLPVLTPLHKAIYSCLQIALIRARSNRRIDITIISIESYVYIQINNAINVEKKQ